MDINLVTNKWRNYKKSNEPKPSDALPSVYNKNPKFQLKRKDTSLQVERRQGTKRIPKQVEKETGEKFLLFQSLSRWQNHNLNKSQLILLLVEGGKYFLLGTVSYTTYQ